MKLIRLAELPDRIFFNWYYGSDNSDNIYPPLLTIINGKYYQLNKFQQRVNEYLYLGELNFYEALKISINQKNTINVVEISNILHIHDLLNIDINKSDMFNGKIIKGKTLVEALKKTRDYPESLKEYIISKDISFKIIIVISQYLDKIGKLLEQYVTEYSPTVSDFRKYLYLFIDYRYYIDLNKFSFDEIKKVIRERNKHYYDLYNKFNQLKKTIYPVNIGNLDNFETSQLAFSFEIFNYFDYINVLEVLNKNIQEIQEFYKFLEKNDIYKC
jgi:hypothetical protein